MHAAAALSGITMGRYLVGAAGAAAGIGAPVDVAARALTSLMSSDKAARAAIAAALPEAGQLANAMHAAYRAAWHRDYKGTWKAGGVSEEGDASASGGASVSLGDAAEQLRLPRKQLEELNAGAVIACARFAAAEVSSARAWLLADDPWVTDGSLKPTIPAMIEHKFECFVSSVAGWDSTRVVGVIDRVDVAIELGGRPHLRVREFKSSQHWKRSVGGISALKKMMIGSVQADLYAVALEKLRTAEKWETEFAQPETFRKVTKAAVAAAAKVSKAKSAVSAKTADVDTDVDTDANANANADAASESSAALSRAPIDTLVVFEGIEDGAFETRIVGKKRRAAAIAHVVDVATAITSRNFAPKPSVIKCSFCDHSRYCTDSVFTDAPIITTPLKGEVY